MNHFYLRVIVPVSVLAPVATAIPKYAFLPPGYRVLLYYLLFAGSMNVVSTVLAVYKIPNLCLLHFYTMAELALLSWFFAKTPATGVSAKGLSAITVLFAVAGIVNFLFFQSLDNFNTYTRPIEGLIVAGCCISYFYCYDAGIRPPGGRAAANCIIAGILLYFSCALLLFVFAGAVLKENNRAMRMAAWNIHATLVLIMYLLIAAGFIQCKK